MILIDCKTLSRIKVSFIRLHVWMEISNAHQFLLLDLRFIHGDPEIPHELVEHLCCVPGVVFLDGMADVMDDFDLELSLHLGDGQLFV